MNDWTAQIIEGNRLRYRINLAKGYGMPWHNHEPDTEHDIFVGRGCIKVCLPGAIVVLPEGARFDPPQGVKHQIVALEDDTLVIHTRHRPFVEPPSQEDMSGTLRYPQIEEVS